MGGLALAPMIRDRLGLKGKIATASFDRGGGRCRRRPDKAAWCHRRYFEGLVYGLFGLYPLRASGVLCPASSPLCPVLGWVV